MENSAPSSKEEPDSRKPSLFLRFTLIILLLAVYINACKEKQTRLPEPARPNADSLRAVRQQFVADSIVRVNATKKKIYITFDDSPNKGTRNVLKTIQNS